MTKVERETLLALAKLGRRRHHSDYEICKVRLWMRDHDKPAWAGVECGDYPPHYTNRKFSQCMRFTEKWLGYFVRRGWVEAKQETAKAGETLVLMLGPVYRITKAGQQAAKAA